MPPPSSLVQLTLDVSSPTSHLPAVDYWKFRSESGWAKSTNGYVGHLCSCKPGCFSFPGWSGNETGPGLYSDCLFSTLLQPLLMSNDLRNLPAESKAILQNKYNQCKHTPLPLLYSVFFPMCREVIAVNQDKLGVQGRLVGSSFVSTFILPLSYIYSMLKVFCKIFLSCLGQE